MAMTYRASAPAMPRYVTDHAHVEDGHLLVTDTGRLTAEQRRELYAMSWAFSAARNNREKWTVADMPNARAVAAYVLIIGNDPFDSTNLDPDRENAREHGVTVDLMEYRTHVASHCDAYVPMLLRITDRAEPAQLKSMIG